MLQYFISTHGARKGLADTALKTANSGYLTRRLVDVAQDAVIAEFDCGTLDGIRVTKLEEAGEVIQPLGDRILGRVALEDVVDPLTGEVIVAGNTELDEAACRSDRGRGHRGGRHPLGAHLPDAPRRVRDVLRTRPRARLHGQHRRGGRHHRRQSIGEPGTQLTMRTFHIGGAAARGKIEQSSLEARTEGIVRLRNAHLAKRKRRHASWS